MKQLPLMPAEDFVRIYGTYVPRLCIDTAVIGKYDYVIIEGYGKDFVPHFRLQSEDGIVLKERDESPRLGQWGLPGGTMYKGETPFSASIRIIQKDLGIAIKPLGIIGVMHFPDEERSMVVGGERNSFTIDSCSIVVLAQAKDTVLHPKKNKNVAWCREAPVVHDIHTPFLRARGLLK